VVDTQPLNGAGPGTDTNAFDSDVILLPVKASALGYDPAAATGPISYTVGAAGAYIVGPTGSLNKVGPIDYDPSAPGIGVAGPLHEMDGAGAVPVTVAAK